MRNIFRDGKAKRSKAAARLRRAENVNKKAIFGKVGYIRYYDNTLKGLFYKGLGLY